MARAAAAAGPPDCTFPAQDNGGQECKTTAPGLNLRAIVRLQQQMNEYEFVDKSLEERKKTK